MTRISLSNRNQKSLDKFLKNTTPKAITQSLLDFADNQAALLEGDIIKNSLSGQRLKRRTGTLARSVIGRGEIRNGVPLIRVGIFRGPALRYAAIQEEGGTIEAKPGKALAIPVGDAVTAAGVSRYGSPRDYPYELRFLPFRRGVAIGKLVDEQEASDIERYQEGSPYEAQALYILVKKVDIPASNWLSAPVLKAIPRIGRELGRYVREQMLDVKN